MCQKTQTRLKWDVFSKNTVEGVREPTFRFGGLPLTCHMPMGKPLNLSGPQRDERFSGEALFIPSCIPSHVKMGVLRPSHLPHWHSWSIHSAAPKTLTSALWEMGASSCKSPTSSATRAPGRWCLWLWQRRSRWIPPPRLSAMMTQRASFHPSLKKVPRESWGQIGYLWSFPSQRP